MRTGCSRLVNKRREQKPDVGSRAQQVGAVQPEGKIGIETCEHSATAGTAATLRLHYSTTATLRHANTRLLLAPLLLELHANTTHWIPPLLLLRIRPEHSSGENVKIGNVLLCKRSAFQTVCMFPLLLSNQSFRCSMGLHQVNLTHMRKSMNTEQCFDERGNVL